MDKQLPLNQEQLENFILHHVHAWAEDYVAQNNQEILLCSVSILSAVSTQKEVMLASSEISCKCEVLELLKPPTIIMMSGFSSTNL